MKQLDGNTLTILVLAELIRRLGGEVSITQGDIDAVAYGRMLEGWGPPGPLSGPLVLKLEQRKGPTQ